MPGFPFYEILLTTQIPAITKSAAAPSTIKAKIVPAETNIFFMITDFIIVNYLFIRVCRSPHLIYQP